MTRIDASTSHGTPEARLMQKRIRKTMGDFALARQGDDELMTISALMTESFGALFEIINSLGYAPTEEQFVKMASDIASVVARGDHFFGVSKEASGS